MNSENNLENWISRLYNVYSSFYTISIWQNFFRLYAFKYFPNIINPSTIFYFEIEKPLPFLFLV